MERLGLKSINLKYLIGRTNLKRDLLYFDKLIYDSNELDMANRLVGPIGKTLLGESEFKDILKFQLAELDYLMEQDLLQGYDANELEKEAYAQNIKDFTEYFDERKKNRLILSYNDIRSMASVMTETSNLLEGKSENGQTLYNNYFFSELVNATKGIKSTPIFDMFFPEKDSELGVKYNLLEVVLNKFPIIDDSVSWEELIYFKSDPDSKRKFSALRNWMIDMSKGGYSSVEASEKFNHLYAEYEHHLDKHKMKTNFGKVKTISITTSEILEDFLRIKWSKAVTTAFEIFERSSRLAEVETNAPGKEVGYVYDLNQDFLKR